MKNIFKMAMGVLALSAVYSMAGQYPFPQNMKHPHGNIIEYADTDMIKEHYKLWKQAWYNASNGWVYAPEGTCSTVSEAIAYGMLITVYMDEQDVFDKLYSVWTSNGGDGGGMNWRIGCSADNGSATDADEDAALALVMASKQWKKDSYLSDATKIINWMTQNDVDGNNSLKPGSGWNPALNPSYVMPGHYRLFEKVTGDSKWSTIRKKAVQDLLACQDSKTGLVGDWCDWSSHKTISSPGAAVSNDIGSYDDAARTPWRTAWAYYWYGDSDSKKFNENLAKWLIPNTRTASGVNSGYKYVNDTYAADESKTRNFISSTFSGGLGLATSSLESDEAKSYLGTVYSVLKEKKSCASADGCGQSVPGEKYYPATLNVLYLLILTGNMPNLYDLTGFEKFTPDPSKAPSVSQIGGVQQAHGDTAVGISGLWNWGGYHDKLGIGTVMVPDSGTSPLYKKDDGYIYAEASMEIGPEPEWTKEKYDVCQSNPAQCELKYPSAGIAVSFKKDECKQTKTCGVDLTALGIKYLRVTLKSSGPIRMAVLNTITDENDAKKLNNIGAGSEPGIYVDPTNGYETIVYDLTPTTYGFKGLGGGNEIAILSWVDSTNSALPKGSDILKNAKGLKWEVKAEQGGIGEISISAVEFLDASKQVVDPVKLTGVNVPNQTNPNPGTNPTAIKLVAAPAMAKVSVAGMNITVEGAKIGADIAVFTLQGKKVASTKAIFGNASVMVPTKGVYLVRVNGKLSKVNVK
ncbi:glycosyl hydrolase family 8 [Fibrobacter sp.]|uniref:glycosyl hydrolase family 8 n=1 Tax=Fibrobacter sp. TaxID=35828 RepID=UPI0038655049